MLGMVRKSGTVSVYVLQFELSAILYGLCMRRCSELVENSTEIWSSGDGSTEVLVFSYARQKFAIFVLE